MTDNRTTWLVAGFAAAFLLTGIPFWRMAYGANVFDDPGIQFGLAALGLITAALAFIGAAPAGRLFWVMLAAFPAAVAVRIAVDVAKDPTSHNLWPIALVMIAGFSLVAIVPGLLVGMLLRRLRA